MVSGWYAHHVAASFDKLRELGRRLEKPVRLIVGPWIHNTTMGDDTRTGDVDYGPEADAFGPMLDLKLRWFDRFVRDIPNGVEEAPRLSYFVMGTGQGHRTPEGRLYHGGEWRTADDWPLPGTRYVAWYLQPGGALATTPPPQGPRRASTTSIRATRARRSVATPRSWAGRPSSWRAATTSAEGPTCASAAATPAR